MSNVYVKTLDDGRVIEAPRNYKNISNFNKFPSLMKKHGFEEKIKGYLKSSGELKYITPSTWEIEKDNYTTIPYYGSSYEWNEEKGTWEIKLEIAKEQKLSEIRNATNDYMNSLKKNFSNAEMETWSRQENGVKLLSENIDSEEYDAVWVKNLAIARGVSLEEMMQRILLATEAMNTAAYQLVGYQQRLEDAINAATTVDQVYTINFEMMQ